MGANYYALLGSGDAGVLVPCNTAAQGRFPRWGGTAQHASPQAAALRAGTHTGRAICCWPAYRKRWPCRWQHGRSWGINQHTRGKQCKPLTTHCGHNMRLALQSVGAKYLGCTGSMVQVRNQGAHYSVALNPATPCPALVQVQCVRPG